ncbi:peptidoglycan-binding protein [Edaphobacter paludis]|uniref:Peptidoglycan-binding protein n=1 Tax=Edaphobacter paludis TaxID=3035702 RepID=A0AAU7D1J2_9BACT
MRFAQLVLCTGLVIATAMPAMAVVHARRGPTSHHSLFHARGQKHSKIAARSIGQRSIDDSRATQIQAALVKSGYLSDPSGHWDANTSAAMEKYQADNGWQTKLVPDSRAIIKLGLGPDHDADRATAASTLGTTESASASTISQ